MGPADASAAELVLFYVLMRMLSRNLREKGKTNGIHVLGLGDHVSWDTSFRPRLPLKEGICFKR